MLILMAWFSVIMAFVGPFVRLDIISVEVGAYLFTVLLGSGLGTLFGIRRRKPERDRWVIALLFGMAFGTAILPSLFDMRVYWVYEYGFSLLASSVPAAMAASLTEILRLLVERYGH